MEQPTTYRTEPLAVWGFVLAFVFWPVGIVLSCTAVRRVRRSGHHGYGLAVAGAALSTVAALASVVGVLGLLSSSGVVARWQQHADEAAATRRDQGAVDSMLVEVSDEIERAHDQGGAWPASSYGLGISPDGAVVVAYRDGDDLCVEVSKHGARGSRAAGTTRHDETCADRGFSRTLQEASDEEVGIDDDAAVAAQVDVARARGQALAERSRVQPGPVATDSSDAATPLTVDDDAFTACAALTANADHVSDPVARLALARVVDGDVGDDVQGAVQNVAWELVAAAEAGDVESFDKALAYGRWNCWLAGFDPPGDDVPADPYGG